ncbi:acetyl-CoA C-acyltransferase [Photobacterium sanctipauli]|uniref:Acetyl-CoA C-acyltransferase n=1 Tax=Photobacterium sanctipauli TaxID=1342794 RepID=A0A2T3NVN7_9GAMM|nr:thiolase family protein [Photobacterium sanctipauli]PSW20298.1 acetyl-CoA C-acyltransferase [Photobacterium sanctipauli]
MSKEVWVVAASRTPIGRFQGHFSSLTAPELGSIAIAGTLKRTDTTADIVDEVYMGNVLSAGCGQAPARQAALGAGLPVNIGCTTLNKVCGSGMKAVMLAYDSILLNRNHVVIAGGMESMTNAPYLQKQARAGQRLGHNTSYDHMFIDGLEDAYEGKLMGVYAQAIADREKVTRHSMDKWAIMSAERALAAQELGWFKEEITPVNLPSKGRGSGGNQSICINSDELPPEINLSKISHLKPAFSANGSVTAANSSAISDGAAALMLMDADSARKEGLSPLAIIKGHTTHARRPDEFTIAPAFAIQTLLDELGWSTGDVDSWEINEAFAVVTQLAIKQLGLMPERVNTDGGACALGHPIGATGARILVTLIHRLNRLQKHTAKPVKGIAALCIGGGEATAMAIEVPVSEKASFSELDGGDDD